MPSSPADDTLIEPDYKHARHVIKHWYLQKFREVHFGFSIHLLNTQIENRIQQAVESLGRKLGRYPTDAEILNYHGVNLKKRQEKMWNL